MDQRTAKPIGPYSPFVAAGRMIFISGQLPVDPDTGAIVPGGTAEQTRQAVLNLTAVLKEASASLSDVVKVSAYLKKMADFQEFNHAYAPFFEGKFPARTTVEVSCLPRDALVELDAIAFLPAGEGKDAQDKG